MALDCVAQVLRCKTLPIRRDDSLLFCEHIPAFEIYIINSFNEGLTKHLKLSVS
jgi:hypothetical protein